MVGNECKLLYPGVMYSFGSEMWHIHKWLNAVVNTNIHHLVTTARATSVITQQGQGGGLPDSSKYSQSCSDHLSWSAWIHNRFMAG